MRCLDANAVQEYLRGPLAEVSVEAHLDSCEDCRALVAAAARLVDEEPPGGRRVSRYVLGERIGAGASGVVHAALDPELGRRVAIKLVTPRADARLLREAQALARVSHENVVPVYDVGTHGEGVFLAMELVDGQDLRAWLGARPRDRAEILDVLVAAGRGLAAAHAAGLVHRDFKPENVLVGVDGRVRVTDFGLARDGGAHEPPTGDAAGADLLAVDLTRQGAVVGTPAYMAPEQLEGQPADARGDQWSFAVTLYEALHGRRPFEAASFTELRELLREGVVPDEPRAPPRLEAVLRRGLARRPEDRFPSMTAMLAALTRARKRPPRSLLLAALLLVAGGGADALLAARGADAARADFAEAGEQVDRALVERYQAFAKLSRVTSVLPVIREVAGNFDKAEFGLGEAGADERRLALLHEGLASADWTAWTGDGGVAIALGDYKGRLVYASGAPRDFGVDLRALPAVARAYQGQPGAMIVAAGDPAARAAGLGADAPLFVCAGSAVPGGVPRAVLVQAVDARRFLDEVAARAETRVALVADGVTVGSLPPGPLPAAGGERRAGGWIASARVLAGPEGAPAIGTLVLARRCGSHWLLFAGAMLAGAQLLVRRFIGA